MLYSIVGTDIENSLAARKAARPDHLARLKALQDNGKLILAGPNPAIDSSDPGPAGFSGSIIIADFSSLSAAKAWADEDPYVAAGVYQNVEVKPFKQAFPN
ncbi:YciI family protein [Marinomonas sp.]|nr:YciI family protein [Marinomonas sp.]MDB4837286.1 YciI family protein [Marinomonas sp.]